MSDEGPISIPPSSDERDGLSWAEQAEAVREMTSRCTSRLRANIRNGTITEGEVDLLGKLSAIVNRHQPAAGSFEPAKLTDDELRERAK